jgi:hypothetical protein
VREGERNRPTQLQIERLRLQLGQLMANFFGRKRCLNGSFSTSPVHPACSAARLRTVLGAPKHRQTAKTIVHESLNNYIGRNYSISVKSIDRKPRNVASSLLQRVLVPRRVTAALEARKKPNAPTRAHSILALYTLPTCQRAFLLKRLFVC